MATIHHLFHVAIAKFDGLLDTAEVEAASAAAIEADLKLNDYPVPYSRPSKTSLDVLYPDVFGPIFEKVKACAEAAYKVKVTSIVGRESVFRDGQHLPVHNEAADAHLSALLWLDWSAKPDHSKRDYAGMFALCNPSGVWGSQKLPWEMPRTQIYEPQPGSLVIHPSYVPHYVYPYKGERPGVEIHFEMKVQ